MALPKIQKIAVRSYQSLENVELILGDITVITGDSDCGKSAFVRAVRQASFNDGGADCLSVFDAQRADRAQVAFQTAEGALIWERTKTTVRYVLALPNQEPKIFQKFGKTMPDEVQAFLGVRETQADATTWERLQFVGQFDPPYLICDRGGVPAARVLGRLTGIHIFAAAAKKAALHGQGLTAIREELKRQVSASETELQQYEGIEERIAALGVLHERVVTCKVRQARLEALRTLRARMQALQAQREAIWFDEREWTFLENLKPYMIQIWNRLARRDRLRQFSTGFTQLAIERGRMQNVASLHLPDLARPKVRMDRVAAMRAAVARFESMASKTRTETVSLETSLQDLARLQSALTQFETSIPLCPFVADFPKHSGNIFRCTDLMKVVGGG